MYVQEICNKFEYMHPVRFESTVTGLSAQENVQILENTLLK